ncbi:MAG TPA: type II toxin-antitoxin system RelE/ParE family toxin [Sphingobium sp.]|uniref:type II toxin-antitoxin system RelE/ParE family toxin n=1 Tax=Sphingobium sp. TaxID=1912891 RepID=UPI002ED2DBB5
MIRREVTLSPEASANLLALYDWISEQASPEIALSYIERLETYIRGFEVGAERGTLRNEIREGLRTVGFERRVTIAFTVNENQVIILGFFYGGQNWQGILTEH